MALKLHKWYALTDKQILEELGMRIKGYRLNANITQDELGKQIGKGGEEISRIEKGKPITLITFLRILRALGELEGLDYALKPPLIDPIEIMKQEGKKRKRATKRKMK